MNENGETALALDDAALREHQAEILRHYRAKRTVEAYRQDWIFFSRWCEGRALDPYKADENVVVAYLTWLSATPIEKTGKSRQRSTIERASDGIAFALRMSGKSAWPERGKPKAVRAFLGAMRRHRRAEKSLAKAPIRLSDLRRLVSACPGDLRGLRDRAILLLSFDGCFRQSELMALEVDDLRFEAGGLVVRVRFSKGDQEGKGLTKPVFYAEDGQLCSIRAVKAWMEAAGIESGPIFRPIPSHGLIPFDRPMESGAVCRILKYRAKLAGFSPEEVASFGGHSPRSGYLTEGAAMGAPLHELAAQAGHKQLTQTLTYFREVNVLKRHTVAHRMK